MSRRSEMIDAVFETLAQEGATDVVLDQDGRGHSRVRFVVAGRKWRYNFPNSPGEHRSLLNTIAGCAVPAEPPGR